MQDYGMAKIWGTARGGSEIAVLLGNGKGMGIVLYDPTARPHPEIFVHLPKVGAKRLITALKALLDPNPKVDRQFPTISPLTHASIYYLSESDQFEFYLWTAGWKQVIVLRREELDILLNRWLVPFWGS